MHSHFLLDCIVVPMHGDTPVNAEHSYSVISHYKKETIDFSQMVMNHYHVAINRVLSVYSY